MLKKSLLIFFLVVVLAGLVRSGEVNWVEGVEPVGLVAKADNEMGNETKTDYGLDEVVKNRNIGGWRGTNSLQWLIKLAVERGLAAETVVLLLLLPVVATLTSAVHYLLGLSGYGVFMPTMVAVVLLNTGIAGGLLLFGTILIVSLVTGFGLRRWKLHFWPSRAIGLSVISVAAFGIIVLSSSVKQFDLTRISIFPVMFMVLLAEEFVKTQLIKSQNEAQRLTVGTLLLAVAGAGLMSWRWLQQMVLVYPEIVLGLVIVINFLIGNYTGIRLLEIKRFRKAIREKEKHVGPKKI